MYVLALSVARTVSSLGRTTCRRVTRSDHTDDFDRAVSLDLFI